MITLRRMLVFGALGAALVAALAAFTPLERLAGGDRPRVPTDDLSVEMYSTSSCTYCRAARVYFRRNGIPFVEHDIEQSAEARERFARLNGAGVPLIFVNGRRMEGFDARRFERLRRAGATG